MGGASLLKVWYFMARLLSLGFEIECLAVGDLATWSLIRNAINATPQHYARTLYDEPVQGRREWLITHDASIKIKAGERGIELVSPPFDDMPRSRRSSSWETSRRAAWQSAVREVLAAVVEVVPLFTNHSTALHVHIGPGIGHTWNIVQLRKIALLFVLFEDQMDWLHPVHRWETSSHTQLYIRSMQQSRILAGRTKEEAGRLILQSASWLYLAGIVNPDPEGLQPIDRNYKVNVTAMGLHGTIEFRQFEGTVQPDRIIDWAETLLALVRLAVRAEEDALLFLCTSGIKLVDLVDLAKHTESRADLAQ